METRNTIPIKFRLFPNHYITKYIVLVCTNIFPYKVHCSAYIACDCTRTVHFDHNLWTPFPIYLVCFIFLGCGRDPYGVPVRLPQCRVYCAKWSGFESWAEQNILGMLIKCYGNMFYDPYSIMIIRIFI